MLRHLIKKELLDHVQSSRFLILCAISWIVIGVSFMDGVAYHNERVASFRLAETASDERVGQIIDADDSILQNGFYWAELFNLGYLLHKPPGDLGVFARGPEPVLGTTMRIGGEPDRRLTRSPAAMEPLSALFAPLDFTAVVRIVLALFVLLLTYDAVSGEKERGTLRLLSSFPMPRYVLVLSKAVGAAVVVSVALVPPLLLCTGLLPVAIGSSLDGSLLARVGILVGGFLLYLIVTSFAGLLGSSLASRSSTSLLLLMGYWVAGVVLLPRVSLVAAELLRSPPVVAEYEARKAAVQREGWQETLKERQEWQEDYRAQHGESHWETPEGREAFFMRILEISQEKRPRLRAERDRIEQEFRNRFDGWMATGEALARLSPAFSLQKAAVSLAGTGQARHQSMLRSLRAHHDVHTDWVAATFNRDALRRTYPEKYGALVWEVEELPRFTIESRKEPGEVQAAMFDLSMVALWGILFAAAASVFMLRYDVR